MTPNNLPDKMCSAWDSSNSSSSHSTSNTERSPNEAKGKCGPDWKRDFSYVPGATLTLMKHSPPKPLGYGYPYEVQREWPEMENMSHAEYCIARPPMEGVIHLDTACTMEVKRHLRVGWARGAQLLVVQTSCSDHVLVAKIYDPLYYEFINRFGTKEDCVWRADHDYSNEAAAYEELDKPSPASKHVPRYYGSWTMNVPTPFGDAGKPLVSRQVRLILMEFIAGTSMAGLNPYCLTETMRDNIVVKALEADAIILHNGVSHHDLAPRNIMCVGSDFSSPDLEVVVFDFNVATVTRLANYKYYHNFRNPQLLWNPIREHWRHTGEFAGSGWISDEENEPEKWLWEHFHDDVRFLPVIRDEDDKKACPKYVLDKLPDVEGMEKRG